MTYHLTFNFINLLFSQVEWHIIQYSFSKSKIALCCKCLLMNYNYIPKEENKNQKLQT